MYHTPFNFKSLSILASLLLLTSSNYAQSIEHTGHIKKNGQSYFINDSRIHFDKMIQLLNAESDSRDYAKVALNTRRFCKNLAIIGGSLVAIRSLNQLRLSSSYIFEPNPNPTLIIGGITLVGYISGMVSSNKSILKGINIFNSKVGNQPSITSTETTYHLEFTGNGLGLKVQF